MASWRWSSSRLLSRCFQSTRIATSRLGSQTTSSSVATQRRWATVVVNFKTKEGKVVPLEVPDDWIQAGNKSVMQLARHYEMPIEAACGGECACCTCHVYVEDGWIDKLDPRDEDEEDLLDIAEDLRDTSRLSCQIKLTKDVNGLVVQLPETSD
eukprot:TRINITY_DN34760_c0_g1_i1.p1 TRINITY_DN34760_c0_g1~~TRINITY_DN34760_c0_g1_i1.p1  ORF type:complete len:154 (-),score=32.80 TRINITY_DN34760_c0_g1_i1:371-832(-)